MTGGNDQQKKVGAASSALTEKVPVSEYQYYEFRAIDHALTNAEMEELQSISTRAEITSTSFTNHYNWGDLKADPLKLLENYFDAFLYVSNWGSRHLCFRLPMAWFDYNELKKILPGDVAWVRRTKQHLIIGFQAELEGADWDDGTGWMGSLLSLRFDLLRGDLRCLYLGWLLSVQNEEVSGNEPGPPVPPGLAQLSPSLESLIDFLEIDEDLVAIAATASAPAGTSPTHDDFGAWIRNLPENEKNNVLLTAVSESGDRWKNELLHRFYRDKKLTSPAITPTRLNVADLLLAARARGEERCQRLESERIAEDARRKAKEEAERAKHLDQLEKREDAVWNDVSALIQTKQPKGYDQAVRFLIDLRDLAIRRGQEALFRAKIETLRTNHAAKTSFLHRLTKANL